MKQENPIENRIKELIYILNEASRQYYSSDDESFLTDKEYDEYLEELSKLENDSGIYFPDSPTINVGHKEDDKVKHYSPILSLRDTKNIDEMLYFLGDKDGILSWKIDGVSIVLHYENGKLKLALSRGDGHYGKDITKNVMLIDDVPKTIPVMDTLIIRGEGCISLKNFDLIKKTVEGEKYSNPRNLASGLINSTKTTNILLNSMHFIAHSPILLGKKAQHIETRCEQLGYLQGLGFNIVPHSRISNFQLKTEIEKYTNDIENFEFPVDGLVLILDDILYGETLGYTAKFPKHSIAFKWPDEIKHTTVTSVEWSVSNANLITPILLFKPISLEGTIVKRANLHNLKNFKKLGIGIGDLISVYKANKIIPVVLENFTRSNTEEYPKQCPICGTTTYIIKNDKTEKLYCGKWRCKDDNK